MVGIVIYHLGGLMEFANLLFRRFTSNEKEKFLIETEEVVKSFNKLNGSDFTTLIETDENFRQLTATGCYDEISVDHSPLPVPDLTNSFPQNEAPQSKKAPWKGWFCFNRPPQQPVESGYTHIADLQQGIKSDSQMSTLSSSSIGK
jgi:hypothetical protein